MFGSSFFYIQSCSNHAIVSPCILAVNQNGLSFLSKETHVGVGWGPSDGGTPRSLLQAGAGPCGPRGEAGAHISLPAQRGPLKSPKQGQEGLPYTLCWGHPGRRWGPQDEVRTLWMRWGPRDRPPTPAPRPQEPVAKFSLKELQATRTQRPAAGSSSPYVEITTGELQAQGVTQLQLEQVGARRGTAGPRACPGVVSPSPRPVPVPSPQGLELCRVVAAHMERLLGAREKRLTLPPSEITLL